MRMLPLDMTPSQETPGLYTADYTAPHAGSYLTEVTADGKVREGAGAGCDDVPAARTGWRRTSTRSAESEALLEGLSEQTGGQAWIGRVRRCGTLPRDISFSEAGMSVRSTKELVEPAELCFLLLLGAADRRVAAAAQVGGRMRRASLLLVLALGAVRVGGGDLLCHGRWAWR